MEGVEKVEKSFLYSLPVLVSREEDKVKANIGGGKLKKGENNLLSFSV